MATVIQIKRSANVSAPLTTDLVEGELAYSFDKINSGAGAKLYIEALDAGDNEVIHAVGGKYYTDKIDNATLFNTPDTLVLRDADGSFLANVVTANEFIGNLVGSISGVADSAVIANTANALTTARVINLAGDLEGNVTFDGSSDVTIYANVLADAIVLGTDTSGEYVGNVTAGTGITTSGTPGEGWSVGIALANTGVPAGHYGGATQIPSIQVDAQGRITSAANVSLSSAITLAADTGAGDTLSNGDTLRISGGTGIDTSVTDNTISVALETSGVVAGVYGNASFVPAITVDATGRITSAANVAVAGVTNFAASGNTFTISTADGGTFSASIQADSVRLGTDTTGDYVQNVLAGTGIEASGALGEFRNVTITLADTAVTPGTYGNATNIPTFVVDQQGRLTSAGNVAISTSFTLNDGTNTDTFNSGDTLRILGGTGISSALTDNTFTITNDGVTSLASGGFGLTVSTSTGAVTVTNTGVTRAIAGTGIGVDTEQGNVTLTNLGVTSLSGTANEVTVSAANGTVQIGLPDDITITRDLSVGGNLNVLGNVVTHASENLVINDSLIQLANNNISADIIDIGFYGSYNGDGGDHEHAGLFRDASDGLFKLFKGLQGSSNLTTTVNISGTGYSTATLVADLVASNANVSVALDFGNQKNQIVPVSSNELEVRGGYGDAAGKLGLVGGNYSTAYSKILLESKKITQQADEVYLTLFNDPNTKLITMNTTHTAAVSNATGALRIAGGIGMTGNLYANYINGTIDCGTY